MGNKHVVSSNSRGEAGREASKDKRLLTALVQKIIKSQQRTLLYSQDKLSDTCGHASSFRTSLWMVKHVP